MPTPLYTNLPQIWTAAVCKLQLDNIPVEEIPQDATITIEKVDEEYMTILPLLYGGAMYNYVAGSRALKLTFTLTEEATIRTAIHAKLAIFHQARIKGTPVIPATELFNVSFTSPIANLVQSWAIPTKDPGTSTGKDRMNFAYEFFVHQGLDHLVIAGAQPAQTS